MGPVHGHTVTPGLWLPFPGRPLEPPDLSQVESVGSSGLEPMFPEYPLGQGRGFTELPAMSAGGKTSRRTRETKQQSPGRDELHEQQGLIQNAVFIPRRNLSCFKFSGPALCGGDRGAPSRLKASCGLQGGHPAGPGMWTRSLLLSGNGRRSKRCSAHQRLAGS